MRDGAFRTADAELKAYSDKLWYHLRLEADLDAHTVTVKVNHQTKGTFALPENITVLNRFELVNTGNTEIGFVICRFLIWWIMTCLRQLCRRRKMTTSWG